MCIKSLKYIYIYVIFKKQGGNSNLNCVPRTAVVAMSDGGGGGGGGGGGEGRRGGGGEGGRGRGEGGSLVPTLSTRCATRGGEGGP